MTKNYVISDLKDKPQFLDITADRIWNAWWKEEGHTLDLVKGLLQDNLTATTIPIAFTAHDNDTFMGTVSLITSDLDSRPHYTPWLAALWVDEQYRSFGVGNALMDAVKQAAQDKGFGAVYLYSIPQNHDYYTKRGWVMIEEDVDGINIYRQDLQV